MLTFSAKSGVCGRYFMTTLFPFDNCPESHSSMPAMILRSVDLPVPFTPMTPIFSPEFTEKSASSNRILSVYAFENPLIVSRFIYVLMGFCARPFVKMSRENGFACKYYCNWGQLTSQEAYHNRNTI